MARYTSNKAVIGDMWFSPLAPTMLMTDFPSWIIRRFLGERNMPVYRRLLLEESRKAYGRDA